MITRRFADLLGRLRKSSRDPDRVRLAAILELNRALARVEDRTTLLRLLLDEAVALFGAERGFVILTGPDAPGWSVAEARSLDREPIRNAERKLSTSILAKGLDEQHAVFCEDAQEGDFGASQSVADMRLRSVLCTPLQAGEAVIGAIYLDHRFQSGAFVAEDLPWLQAFADQAAIALHLHGLLAENREYARAMEVRNRELEARVVEQERELSSLIEDLARSRLDYPYEAVIGEAPALVRCLRVLDRVIPGDFSVLLCGESGTGKELIARAVHEYGPRSAQPFVPVNVAAIPSSLLESELFGHVRGAFTGADRARRGLLREAHGGVLFLDEVTEMDPDVQVKLLRFLEDGMVRPVGGEQVERVDVRVVAATNRAPQQVMAAGTFRQDLYYRLAVVTVDLPPLRERRRDVPVLAEHFLRQAAAERGATPRALTDACLREMQQRSWPGNVRQLRNEVLRLDALATVDEIGPELLSEPVEASDRETLDLADLEQWAIQRALERAEGNKSEAARLLGISRRALYNKLERG